jgi:RNA polymerase sigma factor (sigma-70 family)
MNTQTASTLRSAENRSSPVTPNRSTMEDKPTLRQVFEAEESPLLRFAYGLTGQREAAEDLVQDAFLKLHAHWREVSNPRAWLFKTVRNLALNHLRDHKRESPMENSDHHPAPGSDPGQSLFRLEAIGTLQLLVSELNPQDRQLITLKYHENLKYEEISRRTGLTVGNVGYKLHHALKNLADSLRRLGIESAAG